jgi:hypothetical protein
MNVNPEDVLELRADGSVVMVDEDGVQTTVGPMAEVEVVRAEEEPKSYWEENGFLKDIGNVCGYLEGEREQFLFDSATRQIIETINNARRVEDFDRYSDSELQNFVQTLRSRVPQIEREVMTFINQLTRARAVQVDTVDFI